MDPAGSLRAPREKKRSKSPRNRTSAVLPFMEKSEVIEVIPPIDMCNINSDKCLEFVRNMGHGP